MDTIVKKRIKRTILTLTEERRKNRKRIPVSKIYWKKGIYKELVNDPFCTAE